MSNMLEGLATAAVEGHDVETGYEDDTEGEALALAADPSDAEVTDCDFTDDDEFITRPEAPSVDDVYGVPDETEEEHGCVDLPAPNSDLHGCLGQLAERVAVNWSCA